MARLSARVAQLTAHLQKHRHDFASRRGLERALAQRRKMLKYLYDTDRATYARAVEALGLRDKLSAVAE